MFIISQFTNIRMHCIFCFSCFIFILLLNLLRILDICFMEDYTNILVYNNLCVYGDYYNINYKRCLNTYIYSCYSRI